MQLKRKITVLFLSIALISSIFVPVFGEEKTNAVNNVSTDAENVMLSVKQQVVINMGFINKDILAKEKLTRGEMAAIMAKFYEKKMGGSVNKQLPFTDVQANNANFDAISRLYMMNVISTSKSGRFRPDDPILPDEAAKFFTVLIGRDYLAQVYGGFPEGYSRVAKENKLNALFTSNDGVSGMSMCDVIYETLSISVAKEMKIGSKSEYKADSDNTVLKYYFDAYKTKGIVTGTYYTELGNKRIAKPGDIEIDYNLLHGGNNDLTDYIGYCIEFYYISKEDGDTPTLWTYIPKDNTSVKISTFDVSGYNSLTGVLKYNDGDKTKEEKVSSAIQVIYNGEYKFKYDINLFSPENYDLLTLIDNNDDGEYEIAVFESSEGIVVEKVDITNEIIYSKYGKYYDLSDSSMRWLAKDYNGTLLKLDTIKAGDMLNVYKSNTFLKFVRTTETTWGIIKQISNDESMTTIVVNEKEIVLKHNCYKEEELEIGKKAKIYYDAQGYAAVISFDKNTKKNDLGYIINIEKVQGIAKSLQVKMFNSEGEIVYLEFAEKVSLDGENGVNKTDLYSNLVVDDQIINRVIYYKLNNDGEINKVDTAKINESEDSLHLLMPFTRSVSYKKAPKTFIGGANVGSNTIIMSVPQTNLQTNVNRLRKLFSN